MAFQGYRISILSIRTSSILYTMLITSESRWVSFLQPSISAKQYQETTFACMPSGSRLHVSLLIVQQVKIRTISVSMQATQARCLGPHGNDSQEDERPPGVCITQCANINPTNRRKKLTSSERYLEQVRQHLSRLPSIDPNT